MGVPVHPPARASIQWRARYRQTPSQRSESIRPPMGRLTTHVLDTAHGVPAAGVRITLYRDSMALRADSRRRHQRRRSRDGPLLEGDAFRRRPLPARVPGRRLLPRAGRRPAGSAVRRRGRGRLRHRGRACALPRPAALSRPGPTRPTAAAEPRTWKPTSATGSQLLDPLGAPDRRHRLDRRVVLLHLARQQPAAAPRRRRTPTPASAARCGRCTAAASTTRRSSRSRRPSCPRRCTGSSGRPTRRGSRAFALLRRLTTRTPSLHDRPARGGPHAAGRRSASASRCSSSAGSFYDRCAARSASTERAVARRRDDRVLRRSPHGRCRTLFRGRARTSRSARCSARSWRRTCFFVIIPAQREMVKAKERGRVARSGARPARQAAPRAQQLLHAAGAVHHDQQPLRVDVRARGTRGWC